MAWYVFCFGFIILISLISAANIFNTICTNMNVRKREFAMLRSVGLTQRGYTKMLNLECLIYGIKGLAYGFGFSLPVMLAMYYFSHEKSLGGFYLPWLYVGIAVFCVFLVVYAAMLYGKRKAGKENIIDVLKREDM